MDSLSRRRRIPNWQKGKLNAPGGQVEKDERPIDAMVREFKEEVGWVVWGLWGCLRPRHCTHTEQTWVGFHGSVEPETIIMIERKQTTMRGETKL